MSTYVRGELPGHPVGSTYKNRRHASREKVHQLPMQGIAGNRTVGAVSVVVNGGYSDDEDHGVWLIYTGAGGNDPQTKAQIADQSLDHIGNAALVVSEQNGYPIRLLRGPSGNQDYAPTSGFRYDGLYQVKEHWAETGSEGFLVWRFLMEQVQSASAVSFGAGVDPEESGPPPGVAVPSRTSGVVVRVVRSTAVSDWVKRHHDHTCQVCGTRLDLAAGAYSEGAHIRALGSPHNGPDKIENMLCLCPNHHVQFDKGAIYLDDTLTVRTHNGETLGVLRIKSGHKVDLDHIQAHRARFGLG